MKNSFMILLGIIILTGYPCKLSNAANAIVMQPDTIPPVVINVEPDMNKLVGLNPVITISFNEYIQLENYYRILIFLNTDNTWEEFEIFDENSLLLEDNKLTLTPSLPLLSESEYKLTITGGSISDLAGNLASSYTRIFKTIDNNPPELVNISESFDKMGRLFLTFSEIVVPNNVEAVIKFFPSGIVAGKDTLTQVKNNELIVSFDISEYADSIKFMIEIEGGIVTDTSGNAWEGLTEAGENVWIAGLPDRTGPKLIDIDPDIKNSLPLNDTVSLDNVFILTFNENIRLPSYYVIQTRYRDPITSQYKIFEEMDSSNITINENQMIIDPDRTFWPEHLFGLLITAGSIEDLAGNSNFSFLEGDTIVHYFSKRFWTETSETPVVSFIPEHNDTLTQLPSHLTILFSRKIKMNGEVAIDSLALDSMVYLRKGSENVSFTPSIIESKVIVFNLNQEMPEYGAEYTFGFKEGFVDNSGYIIPAQEASFILRDINYTVSEIQGLTEISPMKGQIARVTGTITGLLDGEGFYLQDDNSPRSGIWISNPGVSELQIGNGAIVVGTVDEVENETTIIAIEINEISAPIIIEPILVDSPLAASNESYESMVVKVQGARASAANAKGEWALYYEIPDSIYVNNRQYDFSLVEGNFYNLTGIVTHNSGTFKLEPRMETDIVNITETTGTRVVSTKEIIVFPNPFDNRINFDKNEKIKRAIIYNIAGIKVIDITYPGHEIDTSHLTNGVYILNLYNEEGFVKARKVIKN